MQKQFFRVQTVILSCILTAMILGGVGCGSTTPKRQKIGFGTEKRFGDLPKSMESIEIDSELWAAKLSTVESSFHQQNDPEHCWAACVQTVLDIHKITPVPTQVALHDDFVASPLYNKDRQAANYDEIRFALAPEYREQMVGYAVVELAATTTSDLVRELSRGNAVIIGLREPGLEIGHAYVAYGMKYREAKKKGFSFAQIGSGIKDAADSTTSFLSGNKPNKVNSSGSINKFEVVEFYLFDPYEPVPEAPEYGGGQKVFTLEKVEGLLDFAISKASAKDYFEKRNAWLKEYDKGPGFYVRNPIDPQGRPIRRDTLGKVSD